MDLQSRTTVYIALGGVFALMGGIIYYASLDNVALEQAQIELFSVELGDVDNLRNQAEFEIVFLVSNPSDKTFTVATIGYEMYGDGKRLGAGQYSVEDIALPGRAVFSPGEVIPLTNTFIVDRSEVGADTYDDAIEGRIANFSAEGIMTTQTSWSVADIEFEIDM